MTNSIPAAFPPPRIRGTPSIPHCLLKAILAALILQQAVAAATTDPDLIELASSGNDFTSHFLEAVAPLRDGAIDNARDSDGRTMLHWAAIRSHQARSLVLLLAGACGDAKDNYGRTPLFYAAEARDPYWNGSGDLMNLEMLTFCGANVNAKDGDGTTPLALAVQNGNYRKVEFLIWRGAIINPDGVPPDKLPLNIALAKNDRRMATLLQTAMKPNAPGGHARESKALAQPSARRFSEAIAAADLNAIEDALESGWNINERDEKGQTGLYRAVANCRPDLADLLIFEGADPNIATKEGKTPLMASMQFLGIDGQRMTAMLLLKGADVNAATKNGETALTAAASSGYDFGVLWLVWAGADPLAPTPRGSLTNYCTHPPTLALLKHFGASDKAPTPSKTDPVSILFEAARKGDLPGIESALQRGVAADTEDSIGNTALVWAVVHNHFDAVDLLLRSGANINYRNTKSGWHILHFLAEWGGKNGDSNAAARDIEKLIARGADPNIPKKDGTTPIMAAAKEGITGANAEALLKAGASINIRNKAGLTALGVASKYGRTEAVQWLRQKGGTE